MTLENQKVVIVGGTAGIGLAVAKAVALQGTSVVVASRSQDKVEQAKTVIKGVVEGYTANVTNEQSIQSLFDRIGEFDHLVLTPGEPVTFTPFLQSDLSYVRRIFETKFWGQYLCIQYGATRIKRNGSITLTSGSGSASKGTSALACINGAVEALSKTLAVELAPVRVNVVRPGMIDTDLWGKFPLQERHQMYGKVGKELLVGRIGTPEEIAQTYLYLMNSGFTTGTALTIDGGTL